MIETHVMNIAGTVYEKETPLFEFELTMQSLTKFKFLCDDMKKFPFFLRVNKRNTWYLNTFLEERVVPPTRQNIKDLLESSGLKKYNVNDILKVTHGITSEDYYWIKFGDDDKTIYEELKIRE